MMKINNLPNYANEYHLIVCNVVDNELWFYGAWNDREKAYSVAKEIDGIVVEKA